MSGEVQLEEYEEEELLEKEMDIDGAPLPIAEEEVEDVGIVLERDFLPVPMGEPHLALYELYQPEELEDGRFACRICNELGQSILFTSRQAYVAHRYKHHGTFLNALPCPDNDCNEAFPSLLALKKHLADEHFLPIETHFKQFRNMAEFETWKSVVEECTATHFTLYNRQKEQRRSMMHCHKSEHKQALSNRHRARVGRETMYKAGAACPAHISFMSHNNGVVDVVFQFFHFGHNTKEQDIAVHAFMERQRHEDAGRLAIDDVDPSKLTAPTLFPTRKRLPKNAAMQYLQLCLTPMPVTPYNATATRYSQLLTVTCIQSTFVYARPIPSPSYVSPQVYKAHVVRQIIDLFSMFACPAGYSVVGSEPVLYEAMDVIQQVFSAPIAHVAHEPIDLDSFQKSVICKAEDELGSMYRWPEVIPFCVHAHNVENATRKPITPFELVFSRRPFHMMHLEERMLEGDRARRNPLTHPHYAEGDHVLVRCFDPRQLLSHEIGPVGKQPSTVFLNGLISQEAFNDYPHFPYKVHLSRSTEAPTLDCPFMWVSPFDISPTTEDLRLQRKQQRVDVMSTLFCSCTDGTDQPPCTLLRAAFCANKMSKTCCEKAQLPCDYHDEYRLGGGETNKRVESLAKNFLIKRRMRVGSERERKYSRPHQQLLQETMMMAGRRTGPERTYALHALQALGLEEVVEEERPSSSAWVDVEGEEEEEEEEWRVLQEESVAAALGTSRPSTSDEPPPVLTAERATEEELPTHTPTKRARIEHYEEKSEVKLNEKKIDNERMKKTSMLVKEEKETKGRGVKKNTQQQQKAPSAGKKVAAATTPVDVSDRRKSSRPAKPNPIYQ